MPETIIPRQYERKSSGYVRFPLNHTTDTDKHLSVYGTATKGGTSVLGTLFRCELDAGNSVSVFDFIETSGHGSEVTQITEIQ